MSGLPSTRASAVPLCPQSTDSIEILTEVCLCLFPDVARAAARHSPVISHCYGWVVDGAARLTFSSLFPAN